MPFVIAFSAVLIIIGLLFLSRGFAARHAQGKRLSPWIVPLLGVIAGLTLLLAGQKLWSLLSLPFLAKLLHLALRLSPRNLFWIIAYQIIRLLRYRLNPATRAKNTDKLANANIMGPREARRILGLPKDASADAVRERAEQLVRASARPQRQTQRYNDDNSKNLVILKVLEAREVMLKDIADRDRQSV